MMNQAVVITGVSRGLGRELFTELLDRDVKLIGIGRHFTFEQKDSSANLLEHDFLMPKWECFAELDAILKGFRRVILVNNAGIVGPIGAIGRLEEEKITSSVQVNVISSMQLINHMVGTVVHLGGAA